MNKSKEIANKTATQAVRTGKDVGSFAKKKVGDIADDINEVAKAENKQKAIRSKHIKHKEDRTRNNKT